MFSC